MQETTNSNWKLAGDRDVTVGIVAINEQGEGGCINGVREGVEALSAV